MSCLTVLGFFLGYIGQNSKTFYQGKDIVLRFIIEYSSLMDFGSEVIINNRSIFFV
jgi:hypothetical protein